MPPDRNARVRDPSVWRGSDYCGLGMSPLRSQAEQLKNLDHQSGLHRGHIHSGSWG